jgi:hypothetical protein
MTVPNGMTVPAGMTVHPSGHTQIIEINYNYHNRCGFPKQARKALFQGIYVLFK